MANEILSKLDALAKSLEDAKGGITDLQEGQEQIASSQEQMAEQLEGFADHLDRIEAAVQKNYKLIVDVQRSTNESVELLTDMIPNPDLQVTG